MTEQQIQSKILKYLNSLPECWAFKAESVTRGVPDVVGVYKSIGIAMEVKTPRGKASKIQGAILRKIAKAGGIAKVVRSVEDAKKIINEIDTLEEGIKKVQACMKDYKACCDLLSDQKESK